MVVSFQGYFVYLLEIFFRDLSFYFIFKNTFISNYSFKFFLFAIKHKRDKLIKL